MLSKLDILLLHENIWTVQPTNESKEGITDKQYARNICSYFIYTSLFRHNIAVRTLK